MTTETRPACRIEFGMVGDSRPVPDLILGDLDDNAFARAVTAHAIPHLRPVLEALGRPELADCMFVSNRERGDGHFMWLDLAGGEGARFCAARIVAAPAAATPTSGAAL